MKRAYEDENDRCIGRCNGQKVQKTRRNAGERGLSQLAIRFSRNTVNNVIEDPLVDGSQGEGEEAGHGETADKRRAYDCRVSSNLPTPPPSPHALLLLARADRGEPKCGHF